jgi:serine protease Do
VARQAIGYEYSIKGIFYDDGSAISGGDTDMKASLFPVALVAVLTGCNMTGPMEMPKIVHKEPATIGQELRSQPTFALDKVIANIRRGTVIAHFPASGVEGTEGYLCNKTHGDNSKLEWATGSSVLGNWSTELGELFYESLKAKGLNVVGNPQNMFSRADAVASAEYLVGARISKLSGNFCEAHHWWDGRPLDTFSGEAYVEVEWVVFSSLQRREILKVTTQGYYKQVSSKRNGVLLAYHQAFASAAENILADKDFVNLASGGPERARVAASGPMISFVSRKLETRSIANRISAVLPAVVTVRLGTGHGSGFVISEDGLILTNQHVVGEAENVSIVLNNGIEVPGRVLARNSARDVALVRIELRVPSFLPLRTELPASLENVFVVGTPREASLKSTVTAGVVSAVRRDPRSDLTFIQSDAAISPGNSGGPLLDRNGNVVGISVGSYRGEGVQGLNLFIPIDDALQSVNLKMLPPPS